jgi:hypothetical protein
MRGFYVRHTTCDRLLEPGSSRELRYRARRQLKSETGNDDRLPGARRFRVCKEFWEHHPLYRNWKFKGVGISPEEVEAECFLMKWRPESRNGAGRNGSYIFQRFITSLISRDHTATSSCPKTLCNAVSTASPRQNRPGVYGISRLKRKLDARHSAQLVRKAVQLLQQPNSAVRAV